MKYLDLLKYSENKIINADKEQGAALIILEYVSKLSSAQIYANMNEKVNEEIINSFNEKLDKYLIDNIPVQYIVGYSCFYGYNFKVNKDVLIPRYETEELVENVLYRYDKFFNGHKVKVADVACGSGCIGITLALEEKNMDLTITDISLDALKIAEYNSVSLGANVKILHGDMLKPLKGMKFDILVSNPPYIPAQEYVMPLVKDNEPNIALFGGEDGMYFYRIILKECKEYLNDKAIIAFEHAYDKKEEMIALVNECLPNAKVEVIKDLNQKDRMTFIYIGDFNV